MKIENDSNIEIFMGCDLVPEEKDLQTTGDLRGFFLQCAAEVHSWDKDDELVISEVFFDRDRIRITLRDGINQ